MSRTRGIVVLAALGLLLLIAAGVGWWRAVSLDADVATAHSETLAQKENVSHVSEELQLTRDDLLGAEERLRKARQRLRNAQTDSRSMQDCVGLAADEDEVGQQSVVFGFVKLGAGRQLLTDEAEWYVGDEANREAIEDGEIGPGDSVPNDYYIRNDDPSRASFAVAEDVVVVTTTADRHNIPAPKCQTWERFTSAMQRPRPWEASLERSPYWLTVRGGEIVRLVEQYLP